MKSIALIAGTRPECIKLAPVYFALRNSSILRPIFVATAQHRQMLDQTLRVFGIEPDVDLDLMQSGQTLVDLTNRVLQAVSAWLEGQKPSAVLVQGDTTTVLASALAAFYQKIPVGHVEAGLRTGDLYSPFPEEMNRRITSPLAKWHFCPTEMSRTNLIREGFDTAMIHVTGNSVIDSLLWVRNRLKTRGIDGESIAARMKISDEFSRNYLSNPKSQWILVTGHRRESFGAGFERICSAIVELTKRFPNVGVLFPVHLNPNVREPVLRIMGGSKNIALVEPAAYEDFVWLMDHCTFILSDSGGVQEEAPTLGKPVLVLRETTERPEGVEAGTCRLVGTNVEKILEESSRLLSDPKEYQHRSALKNPYGDGNTSKMICEILEKELG